MPPPPKPRRGPAARPPVEIKVEENIQKEISVNEAAENAEEVLPVVQPKTEFGKKEAAKGEAVPAEIPPAAHPQPEPGKKEASKEKAVPAEMPKTMVTEEELKKAPVINDVSQCVLCGMCLRGCVGGADGNISRCKNFIFAFPAGNGSKSGKRRKRSFFSLYALHKGRPFHLLKPAKESVYLFPCPGDVYFHFAAEVLYRACQFQFFCHAADRRTEPDTLHSAGHAEPFRHLMFHTRLPKNYFFEIFISHSAAASYPSPVFPHTLNTGASLFKWRIPSIKNSSSKSR